MSSNPLSFQDELSDRDSYFFVALSFLIARNPNSIIPEVMYFMTSNQIITFLHTFGGRKLAVPTVKDFLLDMNCALAAYYRLVEQLEWSEIQTKIQGPHGTPVDINYIQERIDEWLVTLEKENIALPQFLAGERNAKKD